MVRRYIPHRGDIVRLDLGSRAGPKEAIPGKGRSRSKGQLGSRDQDPPEGLAALVVSPREYNRRVGLAQFCPITSRIKGYPFEVLIPDGGKVTGAVLSDQIRSLDWRLRKIQRISSAPDVVVKEVMAKIGALLGD